MDAKSIISEVAKIPKPHYDPRLSSISKKQYDEECDFWPQLVLFTKPKNVLELGTGSGKTTALILTTLPKDSTITTINLPDLSNYRFGQDLNCWSSDARLKKITGDTCDPAIFNLVNSDIDLLFIDSDHRACVAINEMCLYERKLNDTAIVIVDDLMHNDMMDFWNALPYDKFDYGGQGVFVYDKSKPFGVVSNRKKCLC